MIVKQQRRAEILADINERRRESAIRMQEQYDEELQARIDEMELED